MLLGKAALVMILVGVSAQAFSPPALGRIGLSPVVQKQVACACVLGFVVQQHVAVISMEQPGVLEEVAGKPPAFAPNPSPSLRTGTELDLFGWLKDAFANEAYAPPAEGVKANAKHILVKNLELCNQIKAQVASGETTFEDAARQYSTCPSRNEGGSLGNFKPGMMVAEFDKAVFGADSESGKRNPVGEVLGPVETQFGFHLIKIMSRNMPSKTVNGAFTEEVA